MAESCGFSFAVCSRMKSILVVLIPVLAIAACGGSVVNGVNNGGGDGDDGGIGGDAGFTTSCPYSEPSPGTSCAPEGIDCEYGTSNGVCANPYIDCENGKWTEPPPTPGPACLPSTGCPSDESQVQVGTACGDQDLECNFSTGRCTCSDQTGGPIQVNPDGGPIPREWRCEQPQTGCSATRPRLGSACSQEGQPCNYGSCDMPDSIMIQCESGLWVSTPYACAG